jgi:hypothetical protein
MTDLIEERFDFVNDLRCSKFSFLSCMHVSFHPKNSRTIQHQYTIPIHTHARAFTQSIPNPIHPLKLSLSITFPVVPFTIATFLSSYLLNLVRSFSFFSVSSLVPFRKSVCTRIFVGDFGGLEFLV